MRRPSDLASRRYLALIATYALFTALTAFDRLSLSESQLGFPAVNNRAAAVKLSITKARS